MFICKKHYDECIKKKSQNFSWPKSFGPCELCSSMKSVDCFDIPSYANAWKNYVNDKKR